MKNLTTKSNVNLERDDYKGEDKKPKPPTPLPKPLINDLGRTAIDTATGFTGIVTGVAVYLHGSTMYEISPHVDHGKFQEPQWIYVDRLVIKG